MCLARTNSYQGLHTPTLSFISCDLSFSTAMSQAISISNLVLGVLGSAGAVEGLTKIFGDHFPTAQLNSLNETLKTTHEFFDLIADGKIVLANDFKESATKELQK